MSTSLTEQQLRKWIFPPTDSRMLPEETLDDLKLELLGVSRRYRNVPAMTIDQFAVLGMSKQKFIDSVFNRMYNQYSYSVDVLLDKIVSELK